MGGPVAAAGWRRVKAAGKFRDAVHGGPLSRKQPKLKPRPGVDEYGRTPLHHAASDADVARVAALLGEGANPGLPDDDGWTPLHFAAQAQAVEVVRRLLEAGAPVDATDADGNTPLWRAAFYSSCPTELIVLLRRAGADPCRANLHGVTPLQLVRDTATPVLAPLFADLP